MNFPPSLPPLYKKPSCYWDLDTRIAIVFEQERVSVEAFSIRGRGNADEIAKFIIAAQAAQVPASPDQAEEAMKWIQCTTVSAVETGEQRRNRLGLRPDEPVDAIVSLVADGPVIGSGAIESQRLSRNSLPPFPHSTGSGIAGKSGETLSGDDRGQA